MENKKSGRMDPATLYLPHRIADVLPGVPGHPAHIIGSVPGGVSHPAGHVATPRAAFSMPWVTVLGAAVAVGAGDVVGATAGAE